jgi:hypothetical protein
VDEFGALIEGTLKLFLSVYCNDFRADVEHLKAAGAFDHKAQESKSPDGLTLEPLRRYVAARDLIGARGDALVKLIQERRNAIHACKNRPIGDSVEFWEAVCAYRDMLSDVDASCPSHDANRPCSLRRNI